MNENTFSGGVCFSYTLNGTKYFNHYNAQIVSSEIGYRNIMGENKFYFAIYADILAALLGIGSGMAYSHGYNQP
jgi:hypothetical protein